MHALMRKRLTEISVSETAVSCQVTQARAEGLLESLEITKAVPQPAVERLLKVIQEAAQARLAELERLVPPTQG